jgi:hypothetical protein
MLSSNLRRQKVYYFGSIQCTFMVGAYENELVIELCLPLIQFVQKNLNMLFLFVKK